MSCAPAPVKGINAIEASNGAAILAGEYISGFLEKDPGNIFTLSERIITAVLNLSDTSTQSREFAQAKAHGVEITPFVGLETSVRRPDFLARTMAAQVTYDTAAI
ncbi:MAG: hypothetical protein M3O41_13640 [Pseudomonadota bacterium]|nr:hypothetical protein [Pseudomonadota bacterium]